MELTIKKELKKFSLNKERIILGQDDTYYYTLAYVAKNGQKRAVYKRSFKNVDRYYTKWVNDKTGKIDYNYNLYVSEYKTPEIVEFIEKNKKV